MLMTMVMTMKNMMTSSAHFLVVDKGAVPHWAKLLPSQWQSGDVEVDEPKNILCKPGLCCCLFCQSTVSDFPRSLVSVVYLPALVISNIPEKCGQIQCFLPPPRLSQTTDPSPKLLIFSLQSFCGWRQCGSVGDADSFSPLLHFSNGKLTKLEF